MHWYILYLLYTIKDLANFDVKTKDGKGTMSGGREEYHIEYSTETQLNEMFNAFVTNYQRAYEGPNTARAQIGAKYVTGTSSVV